MSITSDLLRGNTETIILSLLAEGDNYGYELNNQIVLRSGGLLELKEATLGFLKEEWENGKKIIDSIIGGIK